MIMALGAAHGRAKPGDGQGTHAVAGVLSQVFPRLGAPFPSHPVQAIEAGRDQLLGRRVRQQVSGKLRDGEPVERLVAVERVDDVIAVRENALALITVVSDSVGEPCQIEPGNGHPLTVMGRLKQPIDDAPVGAGIGVPLEGADLFGRRRQTNQVEREPADEGRPVGLGRWGNRLRFSERIGRMSRLNSTLARLLASAAPIEAGTISPARATTAQATELKPYRDRVSLGLVIDTTAFSPTDEPHAPLTRGPAERSIRGV